MTTFWCASLIRAYPPTRMPILLRTPCPTCIAIGINPSLPPISRTTRQYSRDLTPIDEAAELVCLGRLVLEFKRSVAGRPEKSALKNASAALGNKTYLKKWNAETALSYISSTQDPVLIHDEKKGVGGHFSVIKSYENGIVEISDTEAGNIKYSVEDFKHIYTGEALVISSDASNELLNDIATDISDEQARNIWGKYVPVAVYAANNGYTGAVNTFNTCIANALTQATVTQRNARRTLCYSQLAATLGSSMNLASEAKLFATYNIDMALGSLDTQNVASLNATKNILQQKLNAIKVTLTQKQTEFNSKLKINASVINVANVQPPYDPGASGTFLYDFTQYDVRGRAYRINLNYKFR